MALTQKQVSELYVAIFNRASEGKGNKFWQTKEATSAATADAMLATPDAKEYFGTSLDSPDAFVKHIYKNTLNKEYADDSAGIDYWVSQLAAGKSRGEVVAEIVYAVSTYKDSTDPVTKAAYDQFNNRVEVSNYMAETVENPPADYKTSTQFATTGTTGLVVTNDASTVTTAEKSVDALKPVDGTTFTLTTGSTPDTHIGTEKSDLFNATALNSLQDADVLLDSTTTDSDILNATVTTAAVKARIQNIETINVTGEYVNTGLDLTNVSGTKTLNLDTKLAGGIAKVTNANSINAAAIKAGANISTLDIESLTSGTRDTVNVDGGNADVKLTGAAGGADKYSVTIAKDKTLTLNTLDSSGDVVTANSEANFKLSNANTLTAAPAHANLKVVVNNTSANAITVDASNTTAANTLAKTVELTGGAVTLKGVGAAFDKVEVTSSATKSTIELSSAAAPTDLTKAQVSEVLVSGALTTGITVNENSKLVLAKDQGAGFTLNIDNAKGDMGTKTGTLLLDVNASQAGLKTDTHIDTLFVTAGKLANKTDGTAQTVTITDLDVSATQTEQVVVSGANDLIISKLTGAANDKVIATSMGGKLTINDFAANTTVYGSNNGDTYKATTVGSVLDLKAGSGNDTITLTASTAANKIDAGAGDDLIFAGKGNTTAANTINAGTGNDTVSIAAALATNTTTTVTLGAGSDKVILASSAASKGTGVDVTITDFAKGTDTLVLAGKQTADLDLTKLTQTSSKYAIDTEYVVTLKDVTAKDLSDSIQLGHGAMTVNGTDIAAKAFEAVAGGKIVAGAKDDYISLTGNTTATVASTITTGAGADTVVLTTATSGSNAATATINDFTVGTDKIIVTGLAHTTTATDLTKMAAPTTGDYKINENAVLKLSKDNVNFTTTDISKMVQLGLSTAAYEVALGTTAITGGIFDDFIDLSAATATVTKVSFIDNGGMDTISGFVAGTGKDTLSFDKLTGIDSDGINLTAETKVTAATNGAVYVMKDKQEINGDTIDYSKIGDTVDGVKVKVTDASIMADVAAYIANALDKEAAGEKYVAVINDTSTSTAVDAYAYLVTVNASGGITADDITLIGTVNTGAAALLTDANIA
ncbi:DUF4214 domain-containing protein [Aliarcobacter cryaerophilus]|uniref:DUF4214 domain-containing protein n=1 Tax=Aliarcobacter cryaerophilus TaxID=28198 RepID=UPI003DA535AA